MAYSEERATSKLAQQITSKILFKSFNNLSFQSYSYNHLYFLHSKYNEYFFLIFISLLFHFPSAACILQSIRKIKTQVATGEVKREGIINSETFFILICDDTNTLAEQFHKKQKIGRKASAVKFFL